MRLARRIIGNDAAYEGRFMTFSFNWTDEESKVFEAAAAQNGVYDYVQRIKAGVGEPTAFDADMVAAWDNDNAGEIALHDAQMEVVVVVRNRLEKFLANSEEIKALCAAMPTGFITTLPLEAGRGGLRWDSDSERREREEYLVEADACGEQTEEIDATGLSASTVLDMVRAALIVEASRQAERRADKVVPLRKAA
jgi:hypothetical protein